MSFLGIVGVSGFEKVLEEVTEPLVLFPLGDSGDVADVDEDASTAGVDELVLDEVFAADELTVLGVCSLLFVDVLETLSPEDELVLDEMVLLSLFSADELPVLDVCS